MEAKLYRLTVVLAVIAAIGGGIATYKTSVAYERAADAYAQAKLSTEDGAKQDAIDLGTYTSAMKEELQGAVTATICTPAFIFLVFFTSRWVLTGRLRAK